ncbi:lysozyme inhibitor [Brucella gallinifaecis]|uniref:lysozyme inhibitor n=1 Tax=Brucella gallinifaecis TaxID=215590 RepID=UPI002360F1F5|nr:lysozyme inhibitor [Brucella gallinifaecis]
MLRKSQNMVIALSVALMMSSPVLAQAISRDSVFRQDYICERGVVVPVTYIHAGEEPAFAVLDAEGKMVVLQWHDALKKYVAMDEQDSYRWAEKNGKAVLTHLEADDSAKEVTLLAACRSDESEQ